MDENVRGKVQYSWENVQNAILREYSNIHPESKTLSQEPSTHIFPSQGTNSVHTQGDPSQLQEESARSEGETDQHTDQQADLRQPLRLSFPVEAKDASTQHIISGRLNSEQLNSERLKTERLNTKQGEQSAHSELKEQPVNLWWGSGESGMHYVHIASPIARLSALGSSAETQTMWENLLALMEELPLGALRTYGDILHLHTSLASTALAESSSFSKYQASTKSQTSTRNLVTPQSRSSAGNKAADEGEPSQNDFSQGEGGATLASHALRCAHLLAQEARYCMQELGISFENAEKEKE